MSLAEVNEIVKNLKTYVKLNGLENEVLVIKTGCFGFCAQGPVIKIMLDRTFYIYVEPKDVLEIVESHFIKGQRVEHILYLEQKGDKKITKDIAFYDKQNRIVLKNCGIIDLENIDEYMGNSGYKALSKVISSMTPNDV